MAAPTPADTTAALTTATDDLMGAYFDVTPYADEQSRIRCAVEAIESGDLDAAITVLTPLASGARGLRTRRSALRALMTVQRVHLLRLYVYGV